MKFLPAGAVATVLLGAPAVPRFAPPTLEQARAALGALEGETPLMRRLLEPGADFALIRAPGEGDWLEAHPEPGQTFDQFVAATAAGRDAGRRVLYLLPMGEFANEASPPLEDLRDYAAAYFQLEARILEAVPVDEAQFQPRNNPFTGGRQIRSTAVLAFLRGRVPADAHAVLGVTMIDLYPAPSWNFVFGQASLRDRVGIFSFARYDPAFFGRGRPEGYRDLILRRSCKVLVHETAHTFGLLHCTFFECMANGSNHQEESDARPCHLCPVCLRKLHHAVGFDPVARYEALARFYARLHWVDEERWVRARLAAVADLVSPRTPE